MAQEFTNAGSNEVVLGRSGTYEAVAESRGSTYFHTTDARWTEVHDMFGVGDKGMWNINKAFQLLIVIYCFTGRPGLFNTIRTFVWICTVISLGPLVLGIRFYSVVGGLITMAFIAELFLLYSTLKNQSTASCE